MSAPELCACGCGRPVWRWRLSEPEAQSLAGVCLGKTRFVSMERAAAYARSSQHSYLCLVCDYYHNGNAESARSPEAQRRRLEVLDRLRANGNGWMIQRLAAGFAAMDRAEWKNKGRHQGRGVRS